MFTHLRFSTEEQCQDWSDRVLALRSSWEPPLLGSPLRTLGAPLYRASSESAYRARADRNNAILDEHFGPLFKHLSDKLSTLLAGRVVMGAAGTAFPGFHILDSSEEYLGGPMHFDLQFESFRWPRGAIIGTDTPLSFTLLLEGPLSSGLIATSEHWLRGGDATPRFVPHKRGWLTISTGLYKHGIAPTSAEKGHRISLQGHCLRVAEVWACYW